MQEYARKKRKKRKTVKSRSPSHRSLHSHLCFSDFQQAINRLIVEINNYQLITQSIFRVPAKNVTHQCCYCVSVTFSWLCSMALSKIKSRVSPNASLSSVSDLRGSTREEVNSSTEFANLSNSSTSGLSWRAWNLKYSLTYIQQRSQ